MGLVGRESTWPLAVLGPQDPLRWELCKFGMARGSCYNILKRSTAPIDPNAFIVTAILPDLHCQYNSGNDWVKFYKLSAWHQLYKAVPLWLTWDIYTPHDSSSWNPKQDWDFMRFIRFRYHFRTAGLESRGMLQMVLIYDACIPSGWSWFSSSIWSNWLWKMQVAVYRGKENIDFIYLLFITYK